MRNVLTVIIFVIASATIALATHNRAGEITYRQIGPLTIEITITTYTKTSSAGADRDSLTVQWGDGTEENVLRSNGTGTILDNDVKRNLYIGRHTYPGRGTYTVGFTDPNRVGNILNVNWPNSIDIPFYISTTFTILDPQFQGINNSATLLQAPIDQACVGKVYTHNPNAYDIDGDSLSYELVAPRMSAKEEVPNYRLPDQIGPGDANQLTIDPVTGMITWNTPQVQGEYNIAVKINEWRNGILLNSIIRDMQIFVNACTNDPPIIESIDELCVIAGDTIDIPITLSDPNDDQKVRLEYSGGPFEVKKNAATIDSADVYYTPPYTRRLKWITTCNHIYRDYYQVVLKAEDDAGLSTLKTLRIKVMGPPPQDVQSIIQDSGAQISWQSPYTCELTEDRFFQGFSVWRKKGKSIEDRDSCTTGIQEEGYQRVVYLTKEKIGDRYIAYDKTIEEGATYCYKVTAEFALISEAGYPYNRTESLPSEESCLEVRRALPLITEISVRKTGTSDGIMDITWTKPLKSVVDSVLHPPPYTFSLWRSEQQDDGFTRVPSFDVVSTDLDVDIDTTFVEMSLNTEERQYFYYITMSNNAGQIGKSATSSSVFLKSTAQDKGVELSWEEEVAWTNNYYEIYQITNNVEEFIAKTSNSTYSIANLKNGEPYCFVVKSFGDYGIDDIPSPLINNSQISCAIPMDNTPPCVPVLSVTNTCNDNNISDTKVNILTMNRDTTCSSTEPSATYTVFYKKNKSDTYMELDKVTSPSYTHVFETYPYGCYTVTSTDEAGNESKKSNEVCSDICPVYELPNTFTPNDDGSNDVFIPRVIKYVDRVDMTIYNQWGNVVFQTTDPQINWDGKNVDDGVYYYKCATFINSIDGTTQESTILSGYIQIIR